MNPLGNCKHCDDIKTSLSLFEDLDLPTSKKFGQDYLFVTPMEDKNCVLETCMKTVIIFVISFGDAGAM